MSDNEYESDMSTSLSDDDNDKNINKQKTMLKTNLVIDTSS